ncbi:MAG: HAD-IB family phosphatase [Hyphomicrobiaceae bacterium]|nr:HAD-IB family phosphatase [Hyphomicrobiaceae bacterium]
MAPRETRYSALVDFDGTIAPDDPTDRILEQYADPAWRAIEAEWQAGRITSRVCMQRQAALLRATPAELDAAIRAVRLDPAFNGFVSLCRRRGIEVTVVSDGFDRVVGGTLGRERVALPFFANALQWQGGDRWRLALPYGRADCRSGAANCKCAHSPNKGLWRDERCVVVGDGRSDFCMAMRAGFVIAKGALADFCRAEGLAYASFRNFDDATRILAEWLDRRDQRPGGPRPAARGGKACP